MHPDWLPRQGIQHRTVTLEGRALRDITLERPNCSENNIIMLLTEMIKTLGEQFENDDLPTMRFKLSFLILAGFLFAVF